MSTEPLPYVIFFVRCGAQMSQRCSSQTANTKNPAGNNGIQISNIELGFINPALSMTPESAHTRLQRQQHGNEQLQTFRNPLPERDSEPEYLEPRSQPNEYEEVRDSRRNEFGGNYPYDGQVDIADYSVSLPTRSESGDDDPYDGQVEFVVYP